MKNDLKIILNKKAQKKNKKILDSKRSVSVRLGGKEQKKKIIMKKNI